MSATEPTAFRQRSRLLRDDGTMASFGAGKNCPLAVVLLGSLSSIDIVAVDGERMGQPAGSAWLLLVDGARRGRTGGGEFSDLIKPPISSHFSTVSSLSSSVTALKLSEGGACAGGILT